MTSVLLGVNISEVEVTNVSAHGFWLLLDAEELFVPYAAFPWFKDASIAKLTHVERPHDGHLYWPDIDVDLSIESIRNPEVFPLISK
jgi:hypothetical protein